MIKLDEIREHVFLKLSHLSPSLTYHNLAHTMEVLNQCMVIAKDEGIADEQRLQELYLAALYHDTGFLYAYKGHEEKSCEIAREELPGFDFNDDTINNVCQLILATKVPQQPKNILEQIICDADLDYLGRHDFFIISEQLRKEFLYYNIIVTEREWKKSRIDFIERHSYFTASSQNRRTPMKVAYLAQLKIENDASAGTR